MATKMEICVSYVEEMNEKLGFKPKLPTEFDSIKGLKKQVKKEMAKYDGQLFIFDEEKVSEETWEFLTEDLGIEPRPKKEWASFLKAMEAEDASIPDDEAESEDEGEEEEPEEEPTAEKEEREEDMATAKGEKKTEGTKKGKTGISQKKKTDQPKSNKAQVYLSWNKGKGETDPEKLHKLINKRVGLGTIKGWIGQWKKGKNLPAITKK